MLEFSMRFISSPSTSVSSYCCDSKQLRAASPLKMLATKGWDKSHDALITRQSGDPPHATKSAHNHFCHLGAKQKSCQGLRESPRDHSQRLGWRIRRISHRIGRIRQSDEGRENGGSQKEHRSGEWSDKFGATNFAPAKISPIANLSKVMATLSLSCPCWHLNYWSGM